MNDPFPYFVFLTQRQFGELFGVSAQRIGRWLAELGLRGPDGQPTEQAEADGLVQPVRDGDVAFWSWHKGPRCRSRQRAAGRGGGRLPRNRAPGGWPREDDSER